MCVVQIQPWKDSKKLSVYSEGRVWGQLKIISCSTEFLEGKEHTVKIQQADWKLVYVCSFSSSRKRLHQCTMSLMPFSYQCIFSIRGKKKV